MSKYGEPNTATGQAFRTKTIDTISTALELPIVSSADILKANHPINDHAVSGKQLGSCVLMKGNTDVLWYVAMATGPKKTDKWKYVQLTVELIPS
ncbi:MAG: hypothetical protein ACRDB3_17880 [Citrobacter telavivensis]